MAIALKKTTKLLLVDDDPSMVRLLNKIIERQFADEMELICLTDPKEARRQIEGQLFDILITDLEMPGVNGLELLRCSDITDRKRAEKELKANHARIQELTESITDILWVYRVDSAGTLIEASITAQVDDFLGLDKGTISDDFEKYFSLVHPDDLPGVTAELQHALSSPGEVLEVEYRLIPSDGSTKWVHSRGVAKVLSDGTVKACGRTTDITNRKQAEEEKTKTMAEMERMNKLMSGREKRVIEMKREVNALLAELGRQPQYQSVLKDETVVLSDKAE